MLGIGMILPEEQMVENAKRIIKENDLNVKYLKAVHTVDAVNEARLAVEAGAHIIVARGYQAKLIRQYMNIPIVEMRLHAQEIGLLIRKAKTIVKKPHPHICLIAFENMLGDLSHMEELLEVRLQVVYLERAEEAERVLSEMTERPDIVIGGEVTCRAAEVMGYPSLFFQSTEESVREALMTAQSMSYAAESEKKNTAQIETVLDTSFSGIVQVNTEGRVIAINKFVENLIGKSKEEVTGEVFTEIFPTIDPKLVENVLSGKREECTTSVSMKQKAWMVLIAPLQYESKITGAVISIQKIADASIHKNTQVDMLLHGFKAQTNFQDIRTANPRMKEILENARLFALSDSPVIIYGQAGTEDYLLAEALHNNSNRKAGPYVSINIHGMDKEKQMEELFQREAADLTSEHGAKGAMIKANHGTLFIKGIEHLTLRVQHQILRTMLSRAMMRTDAQPIDLLDVRIIGSSKINLRYLMQKGEFSEELYYLLQGLTLEIPSLNERPEDLRYYFDSEMTKCKGLYNRYPTVTEGGYKKLQELSWNGNMLQIRTFCERLVLSAKKRSIDEVMIGKLYDRLYPRVEETRGEKRVVVYKSQEASELEALLEKHHGSRKKAAEELGISTSTLWRKMKKYGIEANYGMARGK